MTITTTSTALRALPEQHFEKILDSRGRWWNTLLHPRDRFGRFIRTFSRVHYSPPGRSKIAPSFDGNVLAFDRSNGDVLIKLTSVDDGFPPAYGLKPGMVVRVPQTHLETRLVKALMDDVRLNGQQQKQVRNARATAEQFKIMARIPDPARPGDPKAFIDVPAAQLIDEALALAAAKGRSTTSTGNQEALDKFRAAAEAIDAHKAVLGGQSGLSPSTDVNKATVPDRGLRGDLLQLTRATQSLATARHMLGDKQLPWANQRGSSSTDTNLAETRGQKAVISMQEAYDNGRGTFLDLHDGMKKAEWRPMDAVAMEDPRDTAYQQESDTRALPRLARNLDQKVRSGLTRITGYKQGSMATLKDRWHVDKNGETVIPGTVVNTTAADPGVSDRPAATMVVTRIGTREDAATGELKKYMKVRHHDPGLYDKGWAEYEVTPGAIEVAGTDEYSDRFKNLAAMPEFGSSFATAMSADAIERLRRSYATPDARRTSSYLNGIPERDRVQDDINGDALRRGDWVMDPNGGIGIISWISGTDSQTRVQYLDAQREARYASGRLTKVHETASVDDAELVPTRAEAAAVARSLGAGSVAAAIDDPASTHVEIHSAMESDPAFLAAMDRFDVLSDRREAALSAGREPSAELRAELRPVDIMSAASMGVFRDPAAAPERPPAAPSADGITDPPGSAGNQDATVSADGTTTDADAGTRTTPPGTPPPPGQAAPQAFGHRFYSDLSAALGEFAAAAPEGSAHHSIVRKQMEKSLVAIDKALKDRDFPALKGELERLRSTINRSTSRAAVQGTALQKLVNATPLLVSDRSRRGTIPEFFQDVFDTRGEDAVFGAAPAGTVRRPGSPADSVDEDVPITVDIADDEVSKALLEGRTVFYGPDGAPLAEGFAVVDQQSVEVYRDAPSQDDVTAFLADHPVGDGESMGFWRDPNDGQYRLAVFTVHGTSEEANQQAALTEANQFIDISSGVIYNVADSASDPSPTDKSVERAIEQTGEGTVKVARSTARQRQVLEQLAASGAVPDDVKAVVRSALDGSQLDAAAVKVLDDFLQTSGDAPFEDGTGRLRSSSKGIVQQLVDRVAEGTGLERPRGYSSRNTALRRSSDVRTAVSAASGGDQVLLALMDAARSKIKEGDYSGSAADFRAAADILDGTPGGERVAARSRVHADRLDRSTAGKGVPEPQTRAEEVAPAAPTPSAPPVLDIAMYRDWGASELVRALKGRGYTDAQIAEAGGSRGRLMELLASDDIGATVPDAPPVPGEPAGPVTPTTAKAKAKAKAKKPATAPDAAPTIASKYAGIPKEELLSDARARGFSDAQLVDALGRAKARGDARQALEALLVAHDGGSAVPELPPTATGPREPVDMSTAELLAEASALRKKLMDLGSDIPMEDVVRGSYLMRELDTRFAGNHEEALKALIAEAEKTAPEEAPATPEPVPAETAPEPPRQPPAPEPAAPEPATVNGTFPTGLPGLDPAGFIDNGANTDPATSWVRSDTIADGQQFIHDGKTFTMGPDGTATAEDGTAIRPRAGYFKKAAPTGDEPPGAPDRSLESDTSLTAEATRAAADAAAAAEAAAIAPTGTPVTLPPDTGPAGVDGLNDDELSFLMGMEPEGLDVISSDAASLDPDFFDSAQEGMLRASPATHSEADAAMDSVAKNLPNDEQRTVTRVALQLKSAIVRAAAGSGKTTTLETIARAFEVTHPERKVLYVAFNTSVAAEARNRMPGNTESFTADALAWHFVGNELTGKRKANSKDGKNADRALYSNQRLIAHFGVKQTDGMEPTDIVMDSDRALIEFLISADDSISKKHLPGSKTDKEQAEILRVAQAMWADLQNPDGLMPFTNNAAVKIWALSRPDLRNAGAGKKDVLFWDEAQDINDVLAKVLKDSMENMQAVVVGDQNQAIYCQPLGTLVTVVRGAGGSREQLQVAIEDIARGDRVLAYGTGQAHLYRDGCAVTAVERFRHTEGVVRIKTETGLTSAYTPEHHAVVRMGSSLLGKHAVYLMRKGTDYRIGSCSLFYKGPGAQNGIRMRMNQERADAVWLLSVHPDKSEALLQELLVQQRFNLPSVRFDGAHGQDSTMLRSFWEQSAHTVDAAAACLTHFGRLLSFPFIARTGEETFTATATVTTAAASVGSRRAFVTATANLVDGMEVLPEDAVIARGGKAPRSSWVPITVAREVYDDDVVSLTVEKAHTYFGDGILTHNSFRGSKDLLEKMSMEEDHPLTMSYRFGGEIAAVGNMFLDFIDPKRESYRVRGAGPGGEILSSDTMDDAGAVIVRGNSGALNAILDERARGRKVGTAKRFRDNLVLLADSVDSLRGNPLYRKRNKHEDLSRYDDWSEITRLIEDGKAPQKLESLVKRVKEFPPEKLREIAAAVIVTDEVSYAAVPDLTNVRTGPVRQLVGAEVKVGGKTGSNYNMHYWVTDDGTMRLNGIPEPITAANEFRPAEAEYLAWLKQQTGKTAAPVRATAAQALSRDLIAAPTAHYAIKGLTPQQQVDLLNALADTYGKRGEPEVPDVVVTTAHLSKGLEWDRVKVGDDFRGPVMNKYTGELDFPAPEEMRLAHVVVTRAMRALDPGSLDWVFDYAAQDNLDAIGYSDHEVSGRPGDIAPTPSPSPAGEGTAPTPEPVTPPAPEPDFTSPSIGAEARTADGSPGQMPEVPGAAGVPVEGSLPRHAVRQVEKLSPASRTFLASFLKGKGASIIFSENGLEGALGHLAPEGAETTPADPRGLADVNGGFDTATGNIIISDLAGGNDEADLLHEIGHAVDYGLGEYTFGTGGKPVSSGSDFTAAYKQLVVGSRTNQQGKSSLNPYLMHGGIAQAGEGHNAGNGIREAFAEMFQIRQRVAAQLGSSARPAEINAFAARQFVSENMNSVRGYDEAQVLGGAVGMARYLQTVENTMARAAADPEGGIPESGRKVAPTRGSVMRSPDPSTGEQNPGVDPSDAANHPTGGPGGARNGTDYRSLPKKTQQALQQQLRGFARARGGRAGTIAQMRDNVLASIGVASAKERAYGLRWYADAKEAALKLDPTGEHDWHLSAAIIAATSPKTRWEANRVAADLVRRSIDPRTSPVIDKTFLGTKIRKGKQLVPVSEWLVLDPSIRAMLAKQSKREIEDVPEKDVKDFVAEQLSARNADGSAPQLYQYASDTFRTALINANNRVIGRQQQVDAGESPNGMGMRYNHISSDGFEITGGRTYRLAGVMGTQMSGAYGIYNYRDGSADGILMAEGFDPVPRDGTAIAANISRGLGGHKTRSFYNNIITGGDSELSVTIDTHMLDAMILGVPATRSGVFAEGKTGFLSGGQSVTEGRQGTYALFQEGIRQAVESLGGDWTMAKAQAVSWITTLAGSESGWMVNEGLTTHDPIAVMRHAAGAGHDADAVAAVDAFRSPDVRSYNQANKALAAVGADFRFTAESYTAMRDALAPPWTQFNARKGNRTTLRLAPKNYAAAAYIATNASSDRAAKRAIEGLFYKDPKKLKEGQSQLTISASDVAELRAIGQRMMTLDTLLRAENTWARQQIVDRYNSNRASLGLPADLTLPELEAVLGQAAAAAVPGASAAVPEAAPAVVPGG